MPLGDRGRERRQPGLEESDVGIERRVLEPHGHLGVHVVGQLEPARAGHEQARRRGFEVGVDRLPAQRQPAGHLADAFVAGKQVVDAELDVVARLVEISGAGGVELEQSRQRRPRE